MGIGEYKSRTKRERSLGNTSTMFIKIMENASLFLFFSGIPFGCPWAGGGRGTVVSSSWSVAATSARSPFG